MKNITHQNYLSDQGRTIFDQIAATLNGKVEQIDTYELSMLANAYDLYHVFAVKTKEAIDNEEDALKIQRLNSVMEKQWRMIEKFSSNFGMSPMSRSKLESIVKPKTEKLTGSARLKKWQS